MATYSTNLALTLMATGEQSNTWGDTTNTNLGTLLEQAISGYVTQVITDGSSANTTITIPNGATGVARNMFIEMTGALTFSTTSLIVPANKKLYFIYNNTTGGFAVTVKVSGQTGVSVPNGKKMVLVSNGTDIVNAENYIASLSVGALTSGRVPYAGTAGLLQDSANLTFNGTTLTANTIGAFTLGGTVAGGGNQLNNVIIGTTTPLAGAFTTLSASTSITSPLAAFGNASPAAISSSFPVVNRYATDQNIHFGLPNVVGSVRLIAGTNNLGSVIPLELEGSAVNVYVSSTQRGSFSSTGLAVTGTLSATGSLAVNGTTIDSTVWSSSYGRVAMNNGASAAPVLMFQGSTAPADGVLIGAISALNTGAGVTSKEAVDIQFLQDGASVTAPGGKIQFLTRANAGSVAERMMLSSTGLSVTGNVTGTTDAAAGTYVARFGNASIVNSNRGVWIGSDAGGNALIQTYRPSDGNTAAGFQLSLGSANAAVATISSTGLAVTGITTDTLTDTTTTWVNLGYGSFNAKNASNTNNNYSWMTFLESNGNYSGAIGVQNIYHAPASASVEGALIFATKTSGVGGFPTEKMRLDSSGNLLVGNSTDPLGSNRLLVQSAGTANYNRTMSVYNTAATSTTAFANRLLQLSSNGSGADVSIQFTDQVANNAYFGMGSGALYFAIGSGTTKNMTLDASGNLGIGTTSPVGRLNVKSAYVSDATAQQRFEDNTGTGLSFGGTSGGVKWLNVADVGAPSTGYPLAFQTGGTERARIDSSGNLLVGTTSSSGLVGNNAGIVGGIHNTLSGDNSINTSATTVATLPSRDGATYLFTCANISDAGATTYNCASIITQCTTALVATALSTASFASISVSGLNIQITSTLGTKVFKWSLVRIL